MKKVVLFICLMVILFDVAKSQKLPSPSPGKALVIFERPPLTAFAVQFKLFDSTKYLGLMSAGGHLVYECTPGKKIFWASSENRDFLEAELSPDQVYLVQVLVVAGAIQARVKLQPYDPNNKHAKKILQQFIKRIDKGKEKKAEPASEEDGLQVSQQAIQNGIERYQKLKVKDKKITQLTEDMHI